ncbi:hypothetical protein AABD41_01595 [Staphylococcus pseudoxylosus]|uniref:hypothetical protein n=1 Tax=Staphylococcus pseudoxylosus TaxID=2282419 RepID=UPI00398B01AB
MDVKDELRHYVLYEGSQLYNQFKEEIIDEIKDEINNRSKSVSIFWGWGSSIIPQSELIENIMEEIDLPYECDFGNDAKGIEINLEELYMKEY